MLTTDEFCKKQANKQLNEQNNTTFFNKETKKTKVFWGT